MRPVTQLEKRVHQLSKRQKDLTPVQKEWGLSHLIPHYCLYSTKSRRYHCVDCGTEWTGTLYDRCPNCGAVLTVKTNSRQKRFIERKYYGIVQKVKEFSVIRIFYLYDVRRLNSPEHTFLTTEILQHWIDERGHDVIRARNLAMFYYYRHCPFSFNTPLSIKRAGRYNSGEYHIIPDMYYPRMSYSGLLSRNGFHKDFHDFYPESVFSNLLSDNRFETLWKSGMYDFAAKYLNGSRERIIAHWKAVLGTKQAEIQGNEVDLWLDYVDLLDYFGKDTRNKVYLYPNDLLSAHNKLVDKKNEIERRQELERKKQREKDKLAVLQSKEMYFDVTFNDGQIMVIVLKTLEDYRDEGERQHHCVYTNSYYGKKDSIILSARMMDSPAVPVETVELSLKDGKILQCFGRCNKFTEYHQQVIDLVSKNARRFLHIH